MANKNIQKKKMIFNSIFTFFFIFYQLLLLFFQNFQFHIFQIENKETIFKKKKLNSYLKLKYLEKSLLSIYSHIN